MTDGTIRSRRSLRQIVFVAIALASCVLYGAAVLALHQQSQWDNERDSMAVAVSHLAYGAPSGRSRPMSSVILCSARWTAPDCR